MNLEQIYKIHDDYTSNILLIEKEYKVAVLEENEEQKLIYHNKLKRLLFSFHKFLIGCEKNIVKNFDECENDLIKLVEKCGLTSFDTLKETHKSRKREYVIPRQVHMSIIAVAFRLSYFKAGSMYYLKDHATVNYAVKTIKNLLEVDKSMFDDYKELFVYAWNYGDKKRLTDKLNLHKYMNHED